MLTYEQEQAVSHKGPFKGKGAVLAQLAEVEERRRALFDEAVSLARRFRQQYPRSPVYLARYADRTLTTLRWRRSAHNAVTLDLLGEQGRPILLSLPKPVRRDYLRYEQERLALNARLACLAYEEKRLRDWLERLDRLTKTRRELLSSAA